MDEGRKYEIREVTPWGMDGRVWEVTVVSTAVRYRITATGRALAETPAGRHSHAGDWSAEQIERGIHHAIEHDLASPPEKAAGRSYKLNLTSSDLHDANGL